MRSRALLVLASLLIGCQGDDDDTRGHIDVADADGDDISDLDEGRPYETDTDGDGTPDYLDDDSDGDGLLDAYEVGDDPARGPNDSDADGTPDFRDRDSDDNGIDDDVDGIEDLDDDSLPSFRDPDDDGDTARDRDEIGDPTAPVDTDGDGTPDYRDLDSDGDTISDLDEAAIDVDRDHVPDRIDLDSDGDGYLDADEAGDDRLETPPQDLDDDTIPDFRDIDRDDDGLADDEERELGADPDDADSDDDGETDLVEIAACDDPSCANDVHDASASPRRRGAFIFLARYERPPVPTRQTLEFATIVRSADVYFLLDTTSSMGAPLESLKAGLTTPTTGLVDRARAEIVDTWFGVGGYEDFQVAPYGGATDHAYYHVSDVAEDADETADALGSLAIHWGGDGPEALVPALYSLSTGMALGAGSGMTSGRTSCPEGRALGFPCFRSDAVPVIVVITDRPTHNGFSGSNRYTEAPASEAPTYAAAIEALNAARAKVMGIAVRVEGDDAASAQAVRDLEFLAQDTGAIDGRGEPLVSEWREGAIGDVVVDQLRTLANQTPFDIAATYEDDTSDDVDTRGLIARIEALAMGNDALDCEARAAVDTDDDGVLDTFPHVTPGSRVCFDILAAENTVIPGADVPKLYRGTLHVEGDGYAMLDAHDVLFLVPARDRYAGPQ